MDTKIADFNEMEYILSVKSGVNNGNTHFVRPFWLRQPVPVLIFGKGVFLETVLNLSCDD